MTSHHDFNDTVFRTYEEFPLLMPRWGYVVSAFVLFIIGFFGFFLNLMVILLMFKDRQLWTPLNIILFNLVCSDFSVSIVGNPFTLISALFHRWIFGHTMCVLYGFFMSLLGITSITTLTVISFERYMLVTKPLSTRHLTSKGAILLILFIWTYALALTTPPLLGWGNYINEAANISCSVNWHEQSLNTLTYILFLFAMGQILPLSIITFSYVNIIRTMKQTSQRLGRVNRAETRATAMVFIMIISFTIAWTPYSLFALIEQFATEGIADFVLIVLVSPGAGVIPALVAKSSICYDPLIYVGMNTQFRKSIKRIFGMQSKGKNSQSERGCNNTVLSPDHKLSALNDTSVRHDAMEIKMSTTLNKAKKCSEFTDDQSDVIVNEISGKPFNKITDLCTIDEKKTLLDADRSGESSSGNKKVEEVFDNDYNLNDRSPILINIDSERFLFTKVTKQKSNDAKNVYGNQGFEEHTTDLIKVNDSYQRFERPKSIKHSCSLDLGGISHEGKRRKFSFETKLESFTTKSIMNTVVSKLFDQEPKQDNVKTRLCAPEENSGDGVDL